MNKLFYLLILFICLTGTACKHCCEPPPHDLMDATKDSKVWNSFDITGKLYQDSLSITASGKNPDTTETISLKLKFAGTGNYILTKDNVIYSCIIDQSTPAVKYYADSLSDNWVIVGNYDGGTNYIDGSFNIKLRKDPANKASNYPDTISFLNGAFRVHLSK